MGVVVMGALVEMLLALVEAVKRIKGIDKRIKAVIIGILSIIIAFVIYTHTGEIVYERSNDVTWTVTEII